MKTLSEFLNEEIASCGNSAPEHKGMLFGFLSEVTTLEAQLVHHKEVEPALLDEIENLRAQLQETNNALLGTANERHIVLNQKNKLQADNNLLQKKIQELEHQLYIAECKQGL